MRALATLIFWTFYISAAAAAEPAPAAKTLCTLAAARPARFEDILKDYKPFLNGCVRLRGLVAFRRFYDRVQTLYANGAGLPEPGYIALYGSDTVDQDWLWGYRGGVEIAGRVSACELIDTTPDDPNSIVMVIGACHYSSGPLLHVTELRPDTSIASRLYGAAAYADYGTLKPAKADPAKRAAIQSWFDAIRMRDVKAMKQILGWSFSDRDGELKDAVDPAKSPYAFLIGLPTLPKIKFFRTSETEKSQRETVGCICKSGDCGGKWPISDMDADSRPEWPYVCAEMFATGGIAF